MATGTVETKLSPQVDKDIGSTSIYSYVRSASCPVGVSLLRIYNNSDSPWTGVSGMAIINKPSANGDYSVVLAVFTGRMYVSYQLTPADTSLSWAVFQGGNLLEGTITPETGYTISEARCRQTGKTIELHFYVSGSFTSGTAVRVAKISGVDLPPIVIRKLCGYGTHAYDATNGGYSILGTNGNLEVMITATGTKVVLIDFVYTVN